MSGLAFLSESFDPLIQGSSLLFLEFDDLLENKDCREVIRKKSFIGNYLSNLHKPSCVVVLRSKTFSIAMPYARQGEVGKNNY